MYYTHQSRRVTAFGQAELEIGRMATWISQGLDRHVLV